MLERKGQDSVGLYTLMENTDSAATISPPPGRNDDAVCTIGLFAIFPATSTPLTAAFPTLAASLSTFLL